MKLLLVILLSAASLFAQASAAGRIGGTGTQLFPVNAQTSTYQAVALDFQLCKTISVASGTFTVTLVASTSQPANGQCVRVINYGSGVVTVAASGQNINGSGTSQTIAAGSASAPTGLWIASDGTNYTAQTLGLPVPLPVSQGGSGTTTPSLVAGSNVTITGTWPNQTVASTGGGGSGSSVTSTTPVTATANVTTDQALMELALSAGYLNSSKEPFLFNGAGVYTTPVGQTPTLTFKVKLCTISGCGSGTVVTLVSVVTTATLASSTNNNWNLSFMGYTATTGTTGNLEIHGPLSVDLGALTTTADSIFNDVNTAVSGNIDLTAALFVDFTVATSTGSASNAITQRQGGVMPFAATAAPVTSVFTQTGAVGNLTGDVTTAGSTATTITANAVTLSKLATQAADTVLQNATGGSATPTAVAMPTCTTGADLYNTTTHSWSCVSTGGGSVTAGVGISVSGSTVTLNTTDPLLYRLYDNFTGYNNASGSGFCETSGGGYNGCGVVGAATLLPKFQAIGTYTLVTVATLPTASTHGGQTYVVKDGSTATDCTTGGGTARSTCYSTGSAWTASAIQGLMSGLQIASSATNPSSYVFNTATDPFAGDNWNIPPLGAFATWQLTLSHFDLEQTGSNQQFYIGLVNASNALATQPSSGIWVRYDTTTFTDTNYSLVCGNAGTLATAVSLGVAPATGDHTIVIIPGSSAGTIQYSLDGAAFSSNQCATANFPIQQLFLNLGFKNSSTTAGNKADLGSWAFQANF